MTPIFRILKYARGYRSKLFYAVFCSIANKVCDIFPELLIGVAVDIVANHKNSFLANLGVVNSKTQLIVLGIVTIGFYSLESIFEFFHSLFWKDIGQEIQHGVRLDAYSHLQKLDMSFFEEKSSGNLLTVLVDDINLLEQFFNEGANDIIQLITSLVLTSFIFFYISPVIASLVFFPVPIILFITFYFKKKLRPRYFQVRHAAGRLAAKISNNLAGIATIKSYAAEDYENAKLEVASNEYRNANRQAIRLSSTFNPIVRIAILIGYVITLVLGGLYTLDGKLAVGSYSILIFMTQRLLWPFTDLAWLVDIYERAMASARRIIGLLEAPEAAKSGIKALEINAVKGHIVFENVSFAYANGTPVFQNLSFEIVPGQTVAFVGSTGSGKSTIVKLLLKFYDASAGTIYIDNIPLDTYTIESVRKSISLVSQDIFLVAGTIKENILYGTFDASFDQVVQAAKLAEAYDFIMKMPDKFNTPVGERGAKLSGGQRQRVSIARAILKNAPIFIFDEATSAVDNETERAIQHSLEKIEVDHTTIIIAHRLSTIRNADKIFVMEAGQIVESGTHDELIKLNQTYAYLWRLQTGETD